MEMRDDDARGDVDASPTSVPPPRIFGGGPESEEGKIPHSFAPPLAYVFGLDVHGLLFFFTSFYVCAADGA